MIRCDECPRCDDAYPEKTDRDGYHFCICGMTGNKTYAVPHRMKKASGNGHINLGVSTCGLYDTVEDVLSHMTDTEVRRWKEKDGMRGSSFGEGDA